MVYIRGHKNDYDHWAALGNSGWSYADVLPYFKRSEDNADFGGDYHGQGGPLAVGMKVDVYFRHDNAAPGDSTVKR